jgi:hypothetical protein
MCLNMASRERWWYLNNRKGLNKHVWHSIQETARLSESSCAVAGDQLKGTCAVVVSLLHGI